LQGWGGEAITVKDQLIQEIEQASEPVLQETLRLIQLLKGADAEHLEAIQDALDLYEARTVIAQSKSLGEEPQPWHEVKAELGLT
jgi:hypothetical protein